MCLQAMGGKKPLTGEDNFYTMNCTAYRTTKERKEKTQITKKDGRKKKLSVIL